MRYFLFSDVHGNLQALTAVLSDMKESFSFNELNDQLVCLGDVVGYGGNPVECFELVRKRVAPGNYLPGNHEMEVVNESSLRKSYEPGKESGISRLIRRMGIRSGEIDSMFNLTEKMMREGRDYELLKEQCCRPLLKEEESLLFSHGLSIHPEEFHYCLGPSEERSSYTANDAAQMKSFFDDSRYKRKISFTGHVHKTQVITGCGFFSGFTREKIFDGSFSMIKSETREVDLTSFERALVSIPAVGQPREENHDLRTGYAVYDSEGKKVYFRKFPYDIMGAISQITMVGMDSFFAQRLFKGE